MGLGRRQDIGAKGTIGLDVAWRQSREATDPGLSTQCWVLRGTGNWEARWSHWRARDGPVAPIKGTSVSSLAGWEAGVQVLLSLAPRWTV